MESIIVNKKIYYILKLLGKGKGGYSYLVKDENEILYVFKKIHHEKVDYYNFPEDKLSLELNDYKTLKEVGILMPQLIDYDYKCDALIKEYIEGYTIKELIEKNILKESYLDQIRNIANLLKEHRLNIDYYPTNFIVKDDKLYYIDYECNEYHEEWSFDTWGIKYWE